jgi:uncharacterized lipoprotein YddW (UPF0748 family)
VAFVPLWEIISSYFYTSINFLTMNKREFIKTAGLGLTALAFNPLLSCKPTMSPIKQKHWIWMRPQADQSVDFWKEKLAKAKDHGFDAVLMEVYNSHNAWFGSSRLPMREPLLEKLIEAGKATGVEVHAWMWTMPNNIPEIVENHPDWYAVNRAGQPANTQPAYVPYYKFMCSSNPEVREFVRQNVADLAAFDGLAGVHLDYVRLPDVILAEALQPNYNIVQDKEYPEYDYCYCDNCRRNFKEKTGLDPLTDIAEPAFHQEWRQFRYDTISYTVNEVLAPEARKAGKQITAAVFPNWESVRQEWRNWNLDAYLPMLYHNFYDAGLSWVGDQLREKINDLKIKKPVYSGLFIPSVKPEELAEAFRISLEAGAAGVSLFSYNDMKDEHWKVLKEIINR